MTASASDADTPQPVTGCSAHQPCAPRPAHCRAASSRCRLPPAPSIVFPSFSAGVTDVTPHRHPPPPRSCLGVSGPSVTHSMPCGSAIAALGRGMLLMVAQPPHCSSHHSRCMSSSAPNRTVASMVLAHRIVVAHPAATESAATTPPSCYHTTQPHHCLLRSSRAVRSCHATHLGITSVAGATALHRRGCSAIVGANAAVSPSLPFFFSFTPILPLSCPLQHHDVCGSTRAAGAPPATARLHQRRSGQFQLFGAPPCAGLSVTSHCGSMAWPGLGAKKPSTRRASSCRHGEHTNPTHPMARALHRHSLSSSGDFASSVSLCHHSRAPTWRSPSGVHAVIPVPSP